MSDRQKLILASASPRRLSLLGQIGVTPFSLHPADLDETPRSGEWPRSLAARLSKAKALTVYEAIKADQDLQPALILAADTVVALGRRILPKAELTDQAVACLRLLSGRAHRVWTSVTLVTPRGKVRQRLVESRLRFKRLTREDIDFYLASGEWRGKAGAYAIQGIADSFVVKLTGSYSNVVGLPLYETANLLLGEGYHLRSGWLDGRG